MLKIQHKSLSTHNAGAWATESISGPPSSTCSREADSTFSLKYPSYHIHLFPVHYYAVLSVAIFFLIYLSPLLECEFLVQLSSVALSCPHLCDPMYCSRPGFPVHRELLELAQTQGHPVNDVIQPSCPQLSPSPPAFNLSQHQSLFH